MTLDLTQSTPTTNGAAFPETPTGIPESEAPEEPATTTVAPAVDEPARRPALQAN